MKPLIITPLSLICSDSSRGGKTELMIQEKKLVMHMNAICINVLTYICQFLDTVLISPQSASFTE